MISADPPILRSKPDDPGSVYNEIISFHTDKVNKMGKNETLPPGCITFQYGKHDAIERVLPSI